MGTDRQTDKPGHGGSPEGAHLPRKSCGRQSPGGQRHNRHCNPRGGQLKKRGCFTTLGTELIPDSRGPKRGRPNCKALFEMTRLGRTQKGPAIKERAAELLSNDSEKLYQRKEGQRYRHSQKEFVSRLQREYEAVDKQGKTQWKWGKSISQERKWNGREMHEKHVSSPAGGTWKRTAPETTGIRGFRAEGPKRRGGVGTHTYPQPAGRSWRRPKRDAGTRAPRNAQERR